MSNKKTDLEEVVIDREDVEHKEPRMYKVLLHNDNYTTMEFVISVLENVFKKTTEEATKIMLNVHEKGIGIAGIYTYEIGETKVAIVHSLARKNEFPLRCSMEAI